MVMAMVREAHQGVRERVLRGAIVSFGNVVMAREHQGIRERVLRGGRNKRARRLSGGRCCNHEAWY